MLLSVEDFTDFQTMGTASWPEGSVEEYLTRSQTIAELASASYSIGLGKRPCKKSYRGSAGAVFASSQVEYPEVGI